MTQQNPNNNLEPLTTDDVQLYLQQHLTAAKGGLALFKRVAENHPDMQVRETVTELKREVEEDFSRLEEIARRFDASRAPVQEGMAALGEKLGRLKLNGRITSRSPLSDLFEVEALIDGVFAKKQCWNTLRLWAAHEASLDVAQIDSLLARAERQLERLGQLHDATAARYRGE
ncbi:hypothetical protein VVR12_06250 [Rothia sp. LK2588]|uniref:hypothetical protein n=1 Tax=Rothia sp. LK2588 TaxID=3114369 RepID=UPI0034CF1D50